MNQFELYTPGAWLEDGMILPITKMSSHAVDSKKVRRGHWSAAKPVMALCTIATTIALLLPSTPVGVAEMEMVVSGILREVSPLNENLADLVPDGYWSRLDAALASVPRLPDQDISRDPPTMV